MLIWMVKWVVIWKMLLRGVVIIFYLAMVSAVAYTLWSVLLAWNDVSKVAIFGFVNPLCGLDFISTDTWRETGI